jgi:hypothetical protein
LSAIEFKRFFDVTNWGEEIETGTDGETNGDDWKITSTRLPLEVMFPSNDIVH